MHEPIKKAKKEKTVKEKKRKKIEDLIFQKTLKPFNVAKCKLINETIRGKYGDLFPLGNKPIVGVKIHVYCFFLAPKRIVYCPLLERHKDDIKVKITQYNSIQYIRLVFVPPIDPNNLDKIAREKPMSWVDIENSNFFLLGGQHIVMVVKVCFCRT